ncbi:MAG: REP-associated tyrosine transposase [Chitinophagales bacterium]
MKHKYRYYLAFMSTGYQIDDQYAMYFLTFTIVDWVDVFSRKNYRDIVMDSLRFCINEKNLKLYGYVIMTNHVHIIAHSPIGKLSDTIRDFKKYTGRHIIESIKNEPESRREWLLHRFEWNAQQNLRSSDHQVWTHENHAVSITSEKFFRQKLNYIHQNPVRAGWVEREEDYVYSSAKALYNNVKGLLELSYW